MLLLNKGKDFVIGEWGDDLHWDELNEDLSLRGFYNYDRDVI